MALIPLVAACQPPAPDRGAAFAPVTGAESQVAVAVVATPEVAALPLQQIAPGLAATELEALLGPPSLKRQEAEGAFWRYSFVDCNLLVALHADSAGVARIVYFAARARDARGEADLPLERCLAGAATSASGGGVLSR